MKGILFSVLLIVASLATVYGQEEATEQIRWMSWDEAVAMQTADLQKYTMDKTTNPPPKKIFLDIYTGWCGWCKKMDATTFKDSEVAKVMNSFFYPVKLDAEMTDAITFKDHTFINPRPEPVRGRRGTHQLAASLLDNKMSYPSYVIMDENTSRITIHKGYKKKVDLLGILSFFGTNQYVSYKKYLKSQPNQQVQKQPVLQQVTPVNK
jgi:thioredoxin-related protein